MHWIWDYFDSLIQFDRRLQFLLDMLTLFPRCALLEIIEKNLAFLMHIWSRDTKGFVWRKGPLGAKEDSRFADLLIYCTSTPSTFSNHSAFWWFIRLATVHVFLWLWKNWLQCIQKGKQIQISSAVVWLLLFQPDTLAVQGFSSHDPKEERVAKNTTCIERATTLTHRSHGDDSRHIGPDIAMPWLQAWDRCMLQLMWRRTTEITRSSGT